MKQTILVDYLPKQRVRCNMCSFRCVIPPGKFGVCHVRQNRNGELHSLNYGKIIARHVDPIEKKPLFHFHPGSRSFSIATAGCNFRCLHCQNFEISQMPVRNGIVIGDEATPEQVVQMAIETGSKSIAYTYTEPSIFLDYALDIAKIAHEHDIKNVFVTNGYMTAEALELLAPYLDAANVDLKAFTNDFYKRICRARLAPVQENIQLLKKLGIWLEVTTLVIPTLNDSDSELQQIADFIAELDVDIPWHISAFYPAFELRDVPPTPAATLYRAREIGQKAGLYYIYLGNILAPEAETTYCPNCGAAVIERRGYQITKNRIIDGRCPQCQTRISGVGLDYSVMSGVRTKAPFS